MTRGCGQGVCPGSTVITVYPRSVQIQLPIGGFQGTYPNPIAITSPDLRKFQGMEFPDMVGLLGRSWWARASVSGNSKGEKSLVVLGGRGMCLHPVGRAWHGRDLFYGRACDSKSKQSAFLSGAEMGLCLQPALSLLFGHPPG